MQLKDLAAIDFSQRRKTFLNRSKGGVAVFLAAPQVIRNGDVHHPYRQDSNFYYLTGFEEPQSLALLAPESEKPFQIFVHPRDRNKELWEGKVSGPEVAKITVGADEAYPSTPDNYFDEAFIAALYHAEFIYYRLGHSQKLDRRILRLMIEAQRRIGRRKYSLWPIRDPEEILGGMRLIKSKGEIERLQTAATLSAEAHLNAMRLAKPNMYEYEVEALLYHSFRIQGAARLGYPSIVASGPNACVLHYHANNRKMNSGELLLVDAGGEFDYYTADITRTYPVNGRFSQEQREVYLAVLQAQKECIKMAKPGKTLIEIHHAACEILTEELRKLKVLKGTTASLLKKGAFHAFYPHGTSHWIGMDVHDSGPYFQTGINKPLKLEPGMVFSIEPGLYFSPDSNVVPPRYRGIGVRIEDDILVTPTGCKVLTAGAPKELEEVESLCSQS